MDWNYITGFFDADGSITFVKQHKNNERTPVLVFSNNEYNLLVNIKQFIYKQLNITGFICTKTSGDFINYELKYTYLPKCLKILPYIKTKHPKKRKRINMILCELKDITPRNGKYTENIISKREDFTQRFFS